MVYSINLNYNLYGGPYFVDKSEESDKSKDSKSVPYSAFNTIYHKEFINKDAKINHFFTITKFHSQSTPNQPRVATIEVIVPPGLSDHVKEKSLSEFVEKQLLYKVVSISCERPAKDLVPKDIFPLKTHYHGVITNCVVKTGGPNSCDFFEITLRPIFWLLTEQNHYRSFVNMALSDILQKVLKPDPNDPNSKEDSEAYEKQFKGMASLFEIKYDLSGLNDDINLKITQIHQFGESDYSFFVRLMKMLGLSYFMYDNEQTSVLVITSNLLSSYQECIKNVSFKKPLSFSDYIHGSVTGQTIEGLTIPIQGLKETISNHSASAIKTQVTFSDFRSTKIADIEPFDPAGQKAQSYAPTWSLLANTTVSDLESSKKYFLQHASNVWKTQQYADKLNILYLSFGFVQPFQLSEIKYSLKQLSAYKNFKDNNKDPTKCLFSTIEQSFVRPQRTTQDLSKQSPFECYFNVRADLLKIKDNTDEISFPFEYQEPDNFDQIVGQQSNVFSAVVVGFDQSEVKNAYYLPNTIQVQLPWHDKKKNESIKARLLFPWAGDKCGFTFLPLPGNKVLVTFSEDRNYPSILGYFYDAANKFPIKDEDLIKNDKPNATERYHGIVFKNSGEGTIFKYKINSDGTDSKDPTSLTTLVLGDTVINSAQKFEAVTGDLGDKAKANSIFSATKEACKIQVGNPDDKSKDKSKLEMTAKTVSARVEEKSKFDIKPDEVSAVVGEQSSISINKTKVTTESQSVVIDAKSSIKANAPIATINVLEITK